MTDPSPMRSLVLVTGYPPYACVAIQFTGHNWPTIRKIVGKSPGFRRLVVPVGKWVVFNRNHRVIDVCSDEALARYYVEADRTTVPLKAYWQAKATRSALRTPVLPKCDRVRVKHTGPLATTDALREYFRRKHEQAAVEV